MKGQRQVGLVQPVSRRGEGISLPVTHLTGSIARISFKDAPVPDRHYTCDFATVLQSEFEIQLVFAQKKLGSTELRSMIVIHFSFDGLRLFINTLENYDQWKAKTELEGIRATSLGVLSQEPTQTVALSANQALVGYAGRESCLDFYFASAFSLHAMKATNQVQTEPIVRVTFSTALLFGLIDRLIEIAPTLPGNGAQHE